jgi:hypothetical protein
MNTKSAISIIMLASLLACSTPHTVQTATPTSVELPLLAPLQEYAIRDGQLVPRVLLPGRLCQLGTSCLAMDPRPFEPCLLSTKHCSDKAVEPLLVAPAPSIIPAPEIVSR